MHVIEDEHKKRYNMTSAASSRREGGYAQAVLNRIQKERADIATTITDRTQVNNLKAKLFKGAPCCVVCR